MSSMSNIAGLAKYLIKFPDEKMLILLITGIRFFVGVIFF